MADALARIAPLTGLGMILLRADPARSGTAIAAALAMDLPDRGQSSTAGARRLCWMSPDEWLLVLPAAQTDEALRDLEAALAGQFALVLDVSDMRVAFAIEGPRATQVLAKLSPADLRALPEDAVRRTRAAQVACAIWREGDRLVVIGFRSVGEYLAGLLAGAARPGSQLDPR